jgi:hypothetical protein
VQEFFSRLTSEDTVGVVAIVLTFLAGMIVWLSLQWRLHRRTEMEVSLKREMLSRGMSAEEMERVLRAPLGGGAETSDRAPDCARAAGHHYGQHA